LAPKLEIPSKKIPTVENPTVENPSSSSGSTDLIQLGWAYGLLFSMYVMVKKKTLSLDRDAQIRVFLILPTAEKGSETKYPPAHALDTVQKGHSHCMCVRTSVG